MKVSQLYLYPYKSGPAVPVEQAETRDRGFAFDRRFMVTNAEGGFISQRTHPRLGHTTATFDGGRFTLDADHGSIELEAGGGPTANVQVWSDTVAAARCAPEVEEWFSELVGEQLWVVYMHRDSARPSDGYPETPLSFADGFPYLIATEESWVDLNSRIPGDDVPMLAFRPNIVVSGAEPWAEDDWSTLRVGDAIFECTTNCERCRITTLDPDRPGKPRRDGEPLRTLTKFRRNSRGKVDFARNAIAREHAVVQTGDVVIAEP